MLLQSGEPKKAKSKSNATLYIERDFSTKI